jgi:LysR family glycine cleavage system transcriptional activator
MELGLSFLIPSHQAIRAACPGLSLHYFFGSGPELLSRVRTREVDCAVTSARFTDPALSSLPLHREEYVLVAARALLRRQPLARREQADRHTLLDIDSALPLFRYWQEAAAGEELRFGRIWRVGSGAAIHHLVRSGQGVAVLPLYVVAHEIARGTLMRLFPGVKPASDHFRLIFRRDDPRQSTFATLARALLALPLR